MDPISGRVCFRWSEHCQTQLRLYWQRYFPLSGFPAEPAEQLVSNAEASRIHFGAAADVSSGVRCRLRNGELPGSVANSLHLRGKAMDFRVRGISARTLCDYVKTLPRVDEAYAIDDQFVHMGVEKD